MRRLLVILPLAALAVTACSEQIDQTVNDLAASALEEAVHAQLDQAGISLQDAPDCQTDFTRDGTTLTGDATCEATSGDGLPVHAEFDGTLSGSGCTGSLDVIVDGDSVAQLEEIPDCSVDINL